MEGQEGHEWQEGHEGHEGHEGQEGHVHKLEFLLQNIYQSLGTNGNIYFCQTIFFKCFVFLMIS